MNFSKLTSLFAAAAVFFSSVLNVLTFGVTYKDSDANPSLASAVKPDTWAAVDGLGRTLPLNDTVGDKRDEKFVGIFYWDWHSANLGSGKICNTTKILSEHPEIVNDYDNPIWDNYKAGAYYWDEPVYGYYSNYDAYVIRKQAELLADAGVDVIFFDATNGTMTWLNEAKCLMDVFADAVKDGVNVPRIAWMLNFGDRANIHTELTELYDEVYGKGLHEDLWFRWKGKPLVLAQKDSLDTSNQKDRAIKNFFTFRACNPGYFASDFSLLSRKWGWCSVSDQTLYGKALFGRYVEQMTVSVAQNATDTDLVAMNDPSVTVHGRSFAPKGYAYSYDYAGKTVKVDSTIDNSSLYGIQFQKQWDYALEVDPEFVFVTGWNEWIAGRFETWQGTENAFPDEFSPEYSRDIEPSNGVMKDYYYYQLAANIRRFKGANVQNTGSNYAEIDINGGTSQWGSVYTYAHYAGSTKKRDCTGSSTAISYQSETMRNDILSAKVAHDDKNVYFLVQTADDLTPYADDSWMRLFLDTDATGVSKNWEGFEYMLIRDSADSYSLMKSAGGWNWEKIESADSSVSGKTLQISLPLSAIGMTADSAAFNFKWSDNMQQNGDIMDFYKNGDVAPGGRFTFVFKAIDR